jgi:hypothetical protein
MHIFSQVSSQYFRFIFVCNSNSSTCGKVLGGIYASNTSGITAQHLEWVSCLIHSFKLLIFLYGTLGRNIMWCFHIWPTAIGTWNNIENSSGDSLLINVACDHLHIYGKCIQAAIDILFSLRSLFMGWVRNYLAEKWSRRNTVTGAPEGQLFTCRRVPWYDHAQAAFWE